ncbi:MAG: pyruvate formate lyase family protein [Promethearchaeota archaeon]
MVESIDNHRGHDSQVKGMDIAKPHDLSPRAKWLRDFYFLGNERAWNNEYTPCTTGTSWDLVFYEGDYYIVPELYMFLGKREMGPYARSLLSMARKIDLPADFWTRSLPERRALFFQEVMLNHVPAEIISDNDLLAGGRFNTQLSKCLNEKEAKALWKEILRNRKAVFSFHGLGFGNVGATGGHLIPDYKTVVEKGFKYLHEKAKREYEKLSKDEQEGAKGAELRAMMISAKIPKKLAQKYADECRSLMAQAKSPERKKELQEMTSNLERVPWEPAKTFWQALQATWLAHMLVMAEESYPGPGTSFGRLDQYLWPYYKKDVIIERRLTPDFAKDLISSFIFHCNTAYDAQIKIGNQGITSGFGQLMTLSGYGPNGEDLTNELTYMILEVFDQWAPILEPKPNVRLHEGSPDQLLETLIDMISHAQGAPFILNFDERSIAGLIREGIPESEAWDYACVGCLENTMQGNDRSGTVNCNPNLAKSIELVLWNGMNMPENNTANKIKKRPGPKTGNPESFKTWEEFFNAWKKQVKFLIKYTTETYNLTEETRAKFLPTPYVSILVNGCIENGRDIRQAPPLNGYGFVTIEGVGFATTVDSLLAIKKYIYDEKKYTIKELKNALRHDFKGSKKHHVMQALLANKAPKFGNDDTEADLIAREVMQTWAEECWKYKTPTGYQFRPGMLSWNYWAGEDAAFTIATPNGRFSGTYLSNAICPTNGADKKGPTAVTNSVGNALGGMTPDGNPINFLPNGASHTITFNPSILNNEEHREKFKAFLRGYIKNGGTALQINMLDADMLRDAQKHPENYGNLLVRVTGYNAYFTAIGRELQDEIIARESHEM